MVSKESYQQSAQPKTMIVAQLPSATIIIVTISIVTIINSLLVHSHIRNMLIDSTNF